MANRDFCDKVTAPFPQVSWTNTVVVCVVVWFVKGWCGTNWRPPASVIVRLLFAIGWAIFGWPFDFDGYTKTGKVSEMVVVILLVILVKFIFPDYASRLASWCVQMCEGCADPRRREEEKDPETGLMHRHNIVAEEDAEPNSCYTAVTFCVNCLDCIGCVVEGFILTQC